VNWFTGVVLYVIIWWTALFAVLPFGTRPIEDGRDVPGGWRGAPAQPRLLLKAAATTLVAAVLWVACYLVITSPYLGFRSGFLALPRDW
jgi:predicted secreted protein